MYIVLILVLIMLLSISLLIFNYEIMAPPVAMISMFLVCVLVGLLRYGDWELSSYSSGTVLIITAGILAYIIGGYFAYCLYYITHKVSRSRITPCCLSRIEVNNILLLLATGIGIAEVFLFYKFIDTTVLNNGYSRIDITHLLLSYRILSTSSALIDMPRYLSVLKYIVEMNGVLALFILIYNFSFSSLKKKDIFYFLILFCWIGNSILTSSRGDFLTILAIIIYLLYFFVNIKKGFSLHVEYKIVGWGVKLLISFLVVFVALAIFMGRRTSFTSASLLDYLTIYVSGGLRAFDLYVQDVPHISSGIVGNDETFHYIAVLCSRLFDYGGLKPIHLEFREINGQNIGNIYTAFRRYHSDFGIFGVIILSGISGFLMTRLYSKTRYEASIGKISATLLIFAWLSKSILYMPIDDHLYVFIFTLNGLFKIVVLYFLFNFIVSESRIITFGGKRLSNGRINKKECCTKHYL